MKLHSFFASIGASVLLVAGCSDLGQEISIDSEPGILPSSGGETSLTFTPPFAWAASVRTDDGIDSGTCWLTISPISGDARQHTITITAMPNEDADSRNAFIDISSGDKFQTVQVIQLGTDGEISGGDETDEPVQIPATYIRQVTILDPTDGDENNLAFEYDNEGRVITMQGHSTYDDEVGMYYYTISYGDGTVNITGDDGISIEAILDSEGRASEVKYTETGNGSGYNSEIILTYDNTGRLVHVKDRPDGYSESDTEYTWTDGNITRVHKDYYDTDYLYSSYPNTGNIDINWLITGGYGSSIAPLGIIGMLGTRCTDYTYPAYWDEAYETPDMMLTVSEDDLNKPVEKEGYYYDDGEPDITYVFEGPEDCLSLISMETPVERVHYRQSGNITNYDPDNYEIREDGKKYYWNLTVDWGDREETYRETAWTNSQEVIIKY